MSEKTLKFNNIKLNKKEFHKSKHPIDLKSVNVNEIPYRGKKSRGKFSSGKNLVTSEKLVTFPRLIFQIRHFYPTNF